MAICDRFHNLEENFSMDEVAREILRSQASTMKQILVAQESVSTRLNDLTGDIAELRADSKSFGRDCAALCKIVRDGNGTESLVSQVKSNEGRIRGIRRSVGALEEAEKTDNEGAWKVRVALITSMAALLGTIAASIL
jgi:hypothetical protein